MIERIAKLLNKAENAATVHEAQVYFDKAQALATAHSLSLAKARLHAAPQTAAATVTNRTISVGEPRRHANRHLVRLFAVVGQVNGLTVDVAHNSTYVVAYGYAGDIDSAELLWSRIATQMVRFGEAFLATGTWRRDQRILVRHGRRTVAAMTRQTARSTYYEAFIDQIHERLTAAHTQALAVDQTNGGTGTSNAVALRNRDQEVADYYRKASSARGSWNGHRSAVRGRPGSSSRAGARDAHRVALSDSAPVGGPARQLPQ